MARSRRASCTTLVAGLGGQVGLRVFSMLLGGLVTAALGRGLSAQEFGWLAAGLSANSIAMLIADLGLTQGAAVRASTIETDRVPVRDILTARVTTGAIASLPGLALAMFAPTPGTQLALVFIAVSVFCASPCMLQGVLMGIRKTSAVGLVLCAQSLAWTGIAAGLAIAGGPVAYWGGAFLLSQVVQGIATLVLLRGRLDWSSRHDGHASSAFARTATIIRKSAPVGGGALAWALFQRLPVFVLLGISGPLVSGQLAAAQRFSDAAFMLPTSMISVLLPSFASTPKARNRLGGIAAVSLAIGTVIAAGIWAGADWMSMIVFGRSTPGQVYSLQILGLAVIPFALDCVLGSFAVAKGDGRVMFRTGLVAFAVCAMFLIFLAPTLGAVGGAVAILAAQLVRTALLVKSVGGLAVPRVWCWLGVALAAIAGAIGGALNVPAPLGVVVACCLVAGVSAIFGPFRPKLLAATLGAL